MLRTFVIAAILVPGVARADRDLCAPGAKHHGSPIDLDLKQADLQDVLRMLTDVGKMNLVVGEGVTGKVTMHLKQVPWDAATCSIAATHHLTMSVQDNILLVRLAKS